MRKNLLAFSVCLALSAFLPGPDEAHAARRLPSSATLKVRYFPNLRMLVLTVGTDSRLPGSCEISLKGVMASATDGVLTRVRRLVDDEETTSRFTHFVVEDVRGVHDDGVTFIAEGQIRCVNSAGRSATLELAADAASVGCPGAAVSNTVNSGRFLTNVARNIKVDRSLKIVSSPAQSAIFGRASTNGCE